MIHRNSFFTLVNNRRQIATLLMGFASGLPVALCSSTLQAWFTVSGISLMTIGMLTMVGMPYIYKFLWAPLLDRFIPPFLGRRRGWILIMQLLLAVTLAAMALLNPQLNPALLAGLALLVAIFSATQDISIDAYRTDLLQPHERGLGAAMVTIGYRIAMLISGGLALVMAATLGWRMTYLIMAALIVAAVFVTVWAPEPEVSAKPPTTLTEAVLNPLKEFLARPAAVAILIFIAIYKLSDALALALGTTFLIRGMGFDLAQVGATYKTVAISASLLGAFVGGLLMTRMGLYRSLMGFGILQGVSNLAFVVLALVGKNYWLMVNAVFIENFCGGLGNVAFVALLMTLCDLRYSATQFALFSAFSAVGRVFVGPAAAMLALHWGWADFYIISCLAMIPSLILLWWLKRDVNQVQEIYKIARATKSIL